MLTFPCVPAVAFVDFIGGLCCYSQWKHKPCPSCAMLNSTIPYGGAPKDAVLITLIFLDVCVLWPETWH